MRNLGSTCSASDTRALRVTASRKVAGGRGTDFPLLRSPALPVQCGARMSALPSSARALSARAAVALLLLVGCSRPQVVAGPPPDPGALYIEAKKAHGIPETLTCDAKAFVEAPENAGRYALH